MKLKLVSILLSSFTNIKVSLLVMLMTISNGVYAKNLLETIEDGAKKIVKDTINIPKNLGLVWKDITHDCEFTVDPRAWKPNGKMIESSTLCSHSRPGYGCIKEEGGTDYCRRLKARCKQIAYAAKREVKCYIGTTGFLSNAYWCNHNNHVKVVVKAKKQEIDISCLWKPKEGGEAFDSGNY
jgi:hypothetical protein